MERWTGSGKYSSNNKFSEVGIGSVTSRHEIITQMKKRGTAVLQDKKVQITPIGRVFVRALHGKTYDPDLPFRIHEWSLEGCRENMARYIRTVFGRQLRYQRNHVMK